MGAVTCGDGTMERGMGPGAIAVAGTAVLGLLEPVAGWLAAGTTPSGLCRAGTCMGMEPIPI
jgi:hypothetical protein